MNAVDDFLHRLPSHQAAMLSYLRSVVKDASPLITERIAYGIPFFYYKKPLCYFNVKPTGCDVGFIYGTDLKPNQALISANRKQVRSLFFGWDEDVDDILLRQILQECLALPKYATAGR